MFLTFEEKVQALATIRCLDMRRATMILARSKKQPPVAMREVLDDLHRTHYLCDDGIVEITKSKSLQYVEFCCPQQPKALTKEYFYSCKEQKQEELNTAFSVLRCTGLVRDLKPLPIQTRDIKYANFKQAR